MWRVVFAPPIQPYNFFYQLLGRGGIPSIFSKTSHSHLFGKPAKHQPPSPPAPGMFATLGSRPVINVKKWTQNYSGTFGAGSLCFANPPPWESRPEGWSASDGSNSVTVLGLSREQHFIQPTQINNLEIVKPWHTPCINDRLWNCAGDQKKSGECSVAKWADDHHLLAIKQTVTGSHWFAMPV